MSKTKTLLYDVLVSRRRWIEDSATITVPVTTSSIDSRYLNKTFDQQLEPIVKMKAIDAAKGLISIADPIVWTTMLSPETEEQEWITPLCGDQASFSEMRLRVVDIKLRLNNVNGTPKEVFSLLASSILSLINNSCGIGDHGNQWDDLSPEKQLRITESMRWLNVNVENMEFSVRDRVGVIKAKLKGIHAPAELTWE